MRIFFFWLLPFVIIFQFVKFVIVEGPDVVTAQDYKFYLQYLSATKDKTGSQSRKYSTISGLARTAVNSKVGATVGAYDPELATALGLEAL